MANPQIVVTDQANFFRVHRAAYVLQDIYRNELENIFDRCWLYAGHVSELRAPGDFLRRNVGGRNLILTKTTFGELNVLLNACAHRGAIVCQEARGNALSFSCPYHGWTYDLNGRLVGLPGGSAYGPEVRDDPNLSLNQIHHSTYRGLIFISYAAPDQDLEDYLGEAKAYIDLICAQSESELEIIPGEFNHSIRANWKLLAENGVDAYHLPFAHKRFLEYIDTLGGEPSSHKRIGKGLPLSGGHSVIISGPPSTGRPIAYWSPLFPEWMKDEINQRFRSLVTKYGTNRAEEIAHANKSLFIFPNLVINDILGLNVRTFFPTSFDAVDVTVWGAGFSDETEEERAARINGLISFIGPGGFGTPDDVELLESCQRAYAHAGIGYNDFSRGMSPGTQHHTDEEQNRAFWREWSRRIGAERTRAGSSESVRSVSTERL